MKKLNFLVLLLLPFMVNAQQLDYQINAFAIPTHSASWARMNARQSSQEIDATYYNPAGLTSLKDGFHISLVNQSQFVRNQIVTHYDFLNESPKTFPWEIDNFLFPELYAVWKRRKIAVSGFISPALGGGGSTAFSDLPVGEMPIADLTAILEGLYRKDIDYDFNFNFSGFAYAPTFQLGFTYEVVPNLSGAVGVRIVYFINNAEGTINELSLTPANNGNFNELQQTIADLVSGIVDVNLKASQTGLGVTPFVGVNYNYKDKVYLSGKYEFKTPITLTSKVPKNKGGAFVPGTDGVYVDGKKVRSDLPAFYSVGIRYKPIEKVTLAAGQRYFFYKRVNWNGREKNVRRNYREWDIAIEFDASSRWKVSGGYSYADMEIADAYQNDVNFFMPSHTLTVGAAFRVSKVLTLEAGMVKVFYVPTTYYQDYEIFGGQVTPVIEDALNIDNLSLPRHRVKKELSGGVWLFAWSATLHLGKKDK